MRDFFNSILKNKAVMAVLSVIIGILLIVRQGAAVADLIRILGVLLLIAAVVNLITWLSTPKEVRGTAGIAGVVLCVLVGLLFVAAPGWLVSLFPFVMGLAMIISSIMNISGILSSPLRAGLFGPSLGFSILSLVLGILVVLHPGFVANVLIAFVGITLLANGIADLLVIFVIRNS